MITATNLLPLLTGVKRIVSHQQEIEKLKGERFNVFSLLRMERKENGTHSAFLGELLNSNGSHLKGAVFLSHFLQYVNLESHLDIQSTTLTLEYHLGPKDNLAKTGGRVDILLKDKFSKTICIENKIDASDQDAQIERYCHFNKGKNEVIYLSLTGKNPHDISKGHLVAGSDFKILSYKEDIVNWLNTCLKEAADSPMLRETIKQYIILINKMTNTTDNQHQKELIDLLLIHFEEAAYVASNFVKAKEQLYENIRNEVIEKLCIVLGNEFEILKGVPVNKKYAQIWIRFKDYPKSEIYFGIESFNGDGNFNGDLFVGVFNNGGKHNSYSVEKGYYRWWYDQKFIAFQGKRVNFNNTSLIMQLQLVPENKKILIQEIIRESVEFIKTQKEYILSHVSKQTLNA